jgi:RNA polymerase primary sigma factor
MKQLTIENSITNRSQNIERYFNELNRENLITVEEEYELATRIQKGDREALNKLVKANLRFVVSVAKQYSHTPDSLGELIAQGNIGLIEAAETFDPTRGFKFISYAVWSIRKEILNSLTESKTVRLPNHITLDINRSKKAEALLASQLGRDPSISEIVEEMHRQGFEMDCEKLSYIRYAQEKPIPLEPDGVDVEFGPIHWLQSEESTTALLDKNHTIEYVMKMMDILKPAEKRVVLLKHGFINGDEQSYALIAEEFKKSPEWARQVYNIAIRKIYNFAKRRTRL